MKRESTIWRDCLIAAAVSALLTLYLNAADLGTGSPPRQPVAAVKPVKQPKANSSGSPNSWPAGYHEHVCPRCSTRWGHGGDSFGNAAAHVCPNCKTLLPSPWHKATGVLLVPGNCPGGFCPVRP